MRQVSERHFATLACASGNHISTQAGSELWEEQPTGAPSGVGIKPRQANAGLGNPTQLKPTMLNLTDRIATFAPQLASGTHLYSWVD